MTDTQQQQEISIHALLAESDQGSVGLGVHSPISIHALLAESDVRRKYLECIRDISIHALLAESDPGRPPSERAKQNFNPRSPCGERPRSAFWDVDVYIFQSTLSLRRATAGKRHVVIGDNDFNPRSPCGERRYPPGRTWTNRNFNPRSPCGERLTDVQTACSGPKFQSTLSLRRAT